MICPYELSYAVSNSSTLRPESLADEFILGGGLYSVSAIWNLFIGVYMTNAGCTDGRVSVSRHSPDPKPLARSGVTLSWQR